MAKKIRPSKKPKQIRRMPERTGPIATNNVPLVKASDTQNIRNWRLFRKIETHGELADLCLALDPTSGLSRVQISRLESGERPYKEKHLTVLAKVLQCAEGDLINVNPLEGPAIFSIYNNLGPAERKKLARFIAKLGD